MEPLLPMLVALGLMAAVVLGFRVFLRRPRGVGAEDPPGIRTVAIFSGSDPEFFRDDRQDKPFVGVRLFKLLCDALAARAIRVENRRSIQYAQGADCLVGDRRYSLVLEWVEGHWVLGVEWCPEKAAERRHLALTHQVFAPPDSPELRRLLRALDACLKDHPRLHHIGWHRKQDWLMETTGQPAPGPID
ncbi:MAG: hypothetical protein ACUVUC_07240 [Thermoguttaceae bacterium]